VLLKQIEVMNVEDFTKENSLTLTGDEVKCTSNVLSMYVCMFILRTFLALNAFSISTAIAIDVTWTNGSHE